MTALARSRSLAFVEMSSLKNLTPKNVEECFTELGIPHDDNCWNIPFNNLMGGIPNSPPIHHTRSAGVAPSINLNGQKPCPNCGIMAYCRKNGTTFNHSC